MITVEQLFAEDFKPEWKLREEQLIAESFEYATSAAIELKWRRYAAETIRRISRKYDKRTGRPLR